MILSEFFVISHNINQCLGRERDIRSNNLKYIHQPSFEMTILDNCLPVPVYQNEPTVGLFYPLAINLTILPLFPTSGTSYLCFFFVDRS